MSQDSNPSSRPSIWTMILSVLAAMIGIQKNKNRERDFSKGNPWLFMIIGLILTGAFVLLLISIVQTVLINAKS